MTNENKENKAPDEVDPSKDEPGMMGDPDDKEENSPVPLRDAPHEPTQPASSSTHDEAQYPAKNNGQPKVEESELEEVAVAIEDDLDESDIPSHAQLFKQSQWAWLMSSIIWIGMLVVIISLFGGGLGDALLVVPFAIEGLMALIIAGPRYIRWKQTAYYLSDDMLYMTLGGFTFLQKKKRIIGIYFDSMASLELKHGIFGRSLGYGEVMVILKDKRAAKLQYLDEYEGFMDHINANTELPGLNEDPSDAESTQGEGQPKGKDFPVE